MEKYQIKNDVKGFGFQVKSFPSGIGEAFQKLMEMIPKGKERSYYGISYFNDSGNILYYAAAEEINPGEAEKYHCDSYTIEKGEYLTIKVPGWRQKTDQIKDVFHELMQDKRIDNTKPCIEWYYHDEEMMCMMKMHKVPAG